MSKLMTSYTKIATYIKCPRQYKLLYLDNLAPKVKNDSFAIGEGMHNFYEQYSWNPNNSLEHFEDVFRAAAYGSNNLENRHKVEDSIFLVKSYIDSGKVMTPLRKRRKYVTEEWFKDDYGEFIIRGKIDIITKHLSVVDYKTASKFYTNNEIHNIKEGPGLQLTLYASAAKTLIGEYPKKCGFQIQHKKTGEVKNFPTNRTEKDIKKTRDYIKGIVEGLQKDTEFKRGLTPDCTFCYFRGSNECLSDDEGDKNDEY